MWKYSLELLTMNSLWEGYLTISLQNFFRVKIHFNICQQEAEAGEKKHPILAILTLSKSIVELLDG